ncbi:hypothetical protein yc1106_09739 [Curvularia clavata]|uniref:Reticulon domain-containing protein n=1 Tax=Curvularia clavata TaxID=95742 RepID=A0A9Q9DXY8_CURCL|nr:hypothetical protein yc1106_09739 [Curvularia clavata]
MSTQNVIVVPVEGGAGHQPGQDRTEIASTIQQALHEKAHPKKEEPGPFKQIIANQESLYQYINWNDPVRTLGSYVGVLSLLFGAHYLPLTQMVLKGGVTALGLTESASRMLGNRSLSAQLRPREYKTFPESTLNATLKDIHDFVQYAAVQVQRIVFGQDLQKTFISFLSLTTLYWLVKAVPPFWLAVMALTSVYAAPLLASPRGREVIRDAGTQAQELASTATQKGRMAAQDASANAQKLANAATETGRAAINDASARVGSLANSTKETGRAAANSVTSGAQNVANQSNDLAQKGKNTASSLSEQAKNTASQASESVTSSVKSAQQMGTNSVQKTVNTVTTNNASSSSNNNNTRAPVRGPEGDRATPRGTANHDTRQHHSAAASSNPGFTGAAVTDTNTHHPAVMYTTARDEAVERGVLDRSRGVAV